MTEPIPTSPDPAGKDEKATLKHRMTANWMRIRKGLKCYAILVVLIVILVVAVFFKRIFILVRPGQEAVKWSMFDGGTQLDTVYKEGLQIIWPWDKLYIYDVRVQQIPHEFDALSKNGLPIHFEISIRYQPIKETLPILHQQVGPDYVEKIVKPEVQSQVRKIVANYLPEQIYTSEGYLLQIIKQGAMAAINERNIALDDLLIKRMTLPEQIRNAIERKLTAEQLALQYDYVLEKEKKEAERKRIEASGIRDFQKVAKEGGMFDNYLNFFGIEASLELARSNNSKILMIGNRQNGLPIMFNIPADNQNPAQPEDKAKPQTEGTDNINAASADKSLSRSNEPLTPLDLTTGIVPENEASDDGK